MGSQVLSFRFNATRLNKVIGGILHCQYRAALSITTVYSHQFSLSIQQTLLAIYHTRTGLQRHYMVTEI
jgi:hypothetical protein